MGASTRIPKIKEMLAEYLDKPLRLDMNTDEAAALGSCFRAANLSATHRVRKIGFVDSRFLFIAISSWICFLHRYLLFYYLLFSTCFLI